MNNNSKTPAIIQVTNLSKDFMIGKQVVNIIKKVSFEIEAGDFVVIIGPSGCGKSTMLHTILGLEEPSEGEIHFLGENIYHNTDEDYRSNFRKQHIGMVYQQANWIKSLNVVENVAFPLVLLGLDKESAIQKGMDMLKKVGLDEWAEYRPTELSGGQQQRVALARALINNPEIIIADEPTGNLDYKTGLEVMQLFSDLNTQQKKTVVMVTHDLEYVKYAQTTIRMFDGEVVGVYKGADKEKILSELHMKRGSQESQDVPAEPPKKMKTLTL